MSVATHTPGPWEVHPRNRFDFSEVLAGDLRVAIIPEWPLLLAENTANARLMAAAPDLLASLVEMLEFADMGEIHDEETAEAVARAQAAIAKAEGSQP